MKTTIYSFFFLLLIAPCFAIAPDDLSIDGRAGIELQKEENGNYLFTPVINGTWHFSDALDIKAGLSENFTSYRASGLQLPNHHSWRFDLGFAYRVTSALWVEWKWSNRWLIPGHDNVFVEEFDKNRNIIAIYTKL